MNSFKSNCAPLFPGLAVAAIALTLACSGFSARAADSSRASTNAAARPLDSSAASAAPSHAKAGRIDNMNVLDDHYKLTIGDRVSFRVIEDEEPPKDLIVTDAGDLEVPYIGLYLAQGKTCKELARALKTELEKEYYFHATVIVALEQWARSQGKVYTVGAVRLPGPQEIPSDEVLTLSKAILRAGGFTDYASQTHVRVTRKPTTQGGKEEELIINVEEVLKRGNRSGDLPLQDGDLIYVPERLVHF